MERLLDSELWNRLEGQCELELREEPCRQALRPFLAYARELHIIDPYMACAPVSKRRFLELCLQLLRERRGQPAPGRLIIHSGHVCRQGSTTGRKECANSGDPEACLAAWIDRLQGLAVGQTQHTVEVRLWDTQERSAFHDRFLITDQAGLMSGNSFEVGSASSRRRTTWTLLGERRRAAVLHDMATERDLKLLGERTVRLDG